MADKVGDEPGLRQAWNQLAFGMESPEIFYTYEWAMAVQHAYRMSLTPFIFLGYEHDALVGVAALATKRNGNVVFLSADTGDYCDFLSGSDRRQEFVSAVFSELKERKVEKIVLTNLPADSASVEAISYASNAARYFLHVRLAYACARVVLGVPEQRATLKQTVLAKKRLRRSMRELQKRGCVKLQTETNWEQIEPFFSTFRRAHVARFLEAGKVSNLIRDERRLFLEELARRLSPSGWIAFSRLLVGGTTAAWNYGFRFAGSWFWYQPTVNEIYWDFSPGYCLLSKIVEEACDSPEFNVVDLGLGAEGYKERFATANRETLYCELSKSLYRHGMAVLRYWSASLATSSPRLERLIRSSISRAIDLKEQVRLRGMGNLTLRLARRISHALSSFDNVLFFEWPGSHSVPEVSSTRLCPLSAEILGMAAIEYGGDAASLRFLMRSADRLQCGKAEGFALVTAEGMPVHFCWVRGFEGFDMAELRRTLRAPREDAVMIFDCFTPESARGHGFFSEAIARLAERLHRQGKSVWIFGAETNLSSVRGIQKTAFEYKFALGRRTRFFISRTQDSAVLPVRSEAENPVSTS